MIQSLRGDFRLLSKAASMMILSLLVIGILALAFNVQPVRASGTVYIRADGSVDPPIAPIIKSGSVYTVTNDMINSSIVVERNGIILDGGGHVLEGGGIGTGIGLSGRSYVTIENFHIGHYQYGICVQSISSYITIFKNNITDITSGGISIMIKSYSTNNVISENTIDVYGHGVYLENSDHNTICGNNVKKSIDGIRLDPSANSFVYENTVANSTWGIWITGYSSVDNEIFHNNFINDQYSSYCYTRQNWSDSYPSGGNYWSDLGINDTLSGPYQNETGSDGINDRPYPMAAGYNDPFPLAAPFSHFNVTSDSGHMYDLYCVSNSTINQVSILKWFGAATQYIQPGQTYVSLLISGPSQSEGFCRITIPRSLLNSSYTAFVDWNPVQSFELASSNGTHAYLYLTYQHSDHEIELIPEFSPIATTLLFMIATLSIIVFVRRKTRLARASQLGIS
jgi:parallel beta-helix repeat protein